MQRTSYKEPLGTREYYWATETDPVLLRGFLDERAKDFADIYRQSSLWQRIRRNYRYYHNLYYPESGMSERDIVQLGEQGEYAALSVNHHRNLLQQILTLTTEHKPAWNALATNTDYKSLQQTRLANNLLDYYMTAKRVDQVYRKAAEDALVLSVGYVMTTWDPSGGHEIAADPASGQVFFEGDLRWSNPSLFDVYYDPTVIEWFDQDWVMVREWENRWNLMARHPDLQEEIRRFEPSDEDEFAFRVGRIDNRSYHDRVPVISFYHRKTDAMPWGRYVKMLGDNVLMDSDMPYRDLPVDRVVPATFLLSPFGYSPGFDLQGLQEAINREFSAILSNHQGFGVQSIWVPTGANITVKQLHDGLNVVESDVKPEGLNVTATPPEIFNMIPLLIQQDEYLSGMNSVARGQPEASLKSGRALALIDAKAIQFQSGFAKAVHDLHENNGTKSLRIITDFASTKRIVAIAGVHNRNFMRAFSGEDLQNIDRVTVQTGNALQKTLAGRVDMADKLLEMGMIRNKEEYFTLLSTGTLEPMLEAETAQLALVREENERLLQGGSHRALIVDNHMLHAKEHAAQLNTTTAREDPFYSSSVLAAVLEHLQMAMDPMAQLLSVLLGYEVPIPAEPGGGDMNGNGRQSPADRSEQDLGGGPHGPLPGGGSPDENAAEQPFLPTNRAA